MNDTNTPVESPPDPTPETAGLLDSLELVVDNARLLVYGPIAVGILTLAVTFLITPTFTASVRVMPPPQQSQGAAAAMLQSLGMLGSAIGGGGGLKNPGDLYVGLLKSRGVQDALIDKFKLQERYEAKFKETTRKELSNRTRIMNGKDSIIVVEIDDDEPEFAARLADGYSEALGNLLSRLSLTEAQMRKTFFEKQLAAAKAGLDKAEISLRSSSGVSLNALKLSPGFEVGTTAQIKGQLTGLEIKLSAMKGYLSETAPEYKQSLTEIAALKEQLTKIEKESGSTESPQNDYLDKYRDFKYYEALYDLLIKQFEAAKLDEAREGNVMQIVDSAVVPEKKSKPQRAVITLAVTVFSFFMFLGFIFLRRKMRHYLEESTNQQRVNGLKNNLKRVFKIKRLN